MKIAIIGYSGSGKSTLAAWLGKLHYLPVLHLDRVHWLPGWEERSTDDKLDIVRKFLADNENWVIDGNYSKLDFDERMALADRIIFMDFGRFACLRRAYRRYRTYKGKTRESMTAGCPEKLDREFILWILRDGRSHRHKERYARVLREHPHKTIVIRNQRQLDRFMVQEASDMLKEK